MTLITYESIKKDEAIRIYITRADESLAALGYTNVYEFGGINYWTGETVGE